MGNAFREKAGEEALTKEKTQDILRSFQQQYGITPQMLVTDMSQVLSLRRSSGTAEGFRESLGNYFYNRILDAEKSGNRQFLDRLGQENIFLIKSEFGPKEKETAGRELDMRDMSVKDLTDIVRNNARLGNNDLVAMRNARTSEQLTQAAASYKLHHDLAADASRALAIKGDASMFTVTKEISRLEERYTAELEGATERTARLERGRKGASA